MRADEEVAIRDLVNKVLDERRAAEVLAERRKVNPNLGRPGYCRHGAALNNYCAGCSYD